MEKLGIDPILIVAQIVNFLILLYILKKVLYAPVLKMLENRRQRAIEIDDLKRELDEAKDHLKKEEEKIYKKARHEADKILDESRIRGDQLRKQIEAETRTRVKDMMQKADQEIVTKYNQLSNELSSKVAEVAVKVAEEAVAGHITKEQQDRILAESVKRFTNAK